jgi:hypothetical protein
MSLMHFWFRFQPAFHISQKRKNRQFLAELNLETDIWKQFCQGTASAGIKNGNSAETLWIKTARRILSAFLFPPAF